MSATTNLESQQRKRRHETWMRVVYVLSILWAGIPGLMILIMPATSERFLLIDTTDRLTSGLVGSIWLGIGLTALLGLLRPWHHSGLFVFLTMYYGTFLTAIGIPLWADGLDWMAPYVLAAGITLLLSAFAAPWRDLLSRDHHSVYLTREVHGHIDTTATVTPAPVTPAPWRQHDEDDRVTGSTTVPSETTIGSHHTQHLDERLEADRDRLRATHTTDGNNSSETRLHRADAENDALRRQLDNARAEELRRQQALAEARRVREDVEQRLRHAGGDHRRAA